MCHVAAVSVSLPYLCPIATSILPSVSGAQSKPHLAFKPSLAGQLLLWLRLQEAVCLLCRALQYRHIRCTHALLQRQDTVCWVTNYTGMSNCALIMPLRIFDLFCILMYDSSVRTSCHSYLLCIFSPDMQGIYDIGYGTVLDSGTTFSYLPSAAFDQLRRHVSEYALQSGLHSTPGPDPKFQDTCFGGAPAFDHPRELAQVFPTLELHFEVKLALRARMVHAAFTHTYATQHEARMAHSGPKATRCCLS